MTDKSYEEWMREYKEKCGEPILVDENAKAVRDTELIRKLKKMGLWERMTDWRLKVRRPGKEGKE